MPPGSRNKKRLLFLLSRDLCLTHSLFLSGSPSCTFVGKHGPWRIAFPITAHVCTEHSRGRSLFSVILTTAPTGGQGMTWPLFSRCGDTGGEMPPPPRPRPAPPRPAVGGGANAEPGRYHVRGQISVPGVFHSAPPPPPSLATLTLSRLHLGFKTKSNKQAKFLVCCSLSQSNEAGRLSSHHVLTEE